MSIKGRLLTSADRVYTAALLRSGLTATGRAEVEELSLLIFRVQLSAEVRNREDDFMVQGRRPRDLQLQSEAEEQ